MTFLLVMIVILLVLCVYVLHDIKEGQDHQTEQINEAIQAAINKQLYAKRKVDRRKDT